MKRPEDFEREYVVSLVAFWIALAAVAGVVFTIWLTFK